MIQERYELVFDRISDIAKEEKLSEPQGLYFKQVALFLVDIGNCYNEINKKGLFATEKSSLKNWNEKLYKKLAKANYEIDYLNPVVAVKRFGLELGQILSMVYFEMTSLIPMAFEQDLEEITLRMEWFVELYTMFVDAKEDEKEINIQRVKESVYYFFHDNVESYFEKRIAMKTNPEMDFALQVIQNSDLSNPDYLYRFGEYVGENEIGTAKYLAAASKEQIQLMADTYTEGYRIGFEKTGKDLSKKEVVQIVYPIGFERMILAAIKNFERMGLRVTIMRTPHSLFDKRNMNVGGFYSTSVNKQLEFDHKEDEGLFLDKKYASRKLKASEKAYKKVKELAKRHAGPAWVEVFGEIPFAPQNQLETVKYTKKQQELSTWYMMQNSQIINTFIPGEERSFTIIAFPIPQIGKDYEAIMEETIKLNTLDYKTYEKIQAKIIDALDAADYVMIEGSGENRTKLRVSLVSLSDSEKQTKFENCVADVNIPVGEVFTSPVLAGTSGILHVSKVYLGELEYKNLWMKFEDGMVIDYGCDNFATEKENKEYIQENVLFHHNSLPMGEFAIGTNTTAYRMGRKYDIAGRLPILIAEKTGPHFAVGDTCYSQAEDVAVFNENGKEIIARDNEVSILRKEDISKAYFNCHTDITLAYDELDALYGVKTDGEEIPIIKEGRFVLEGTEKLNVALD